MTVNDVVKMVNEIKSNDTMNLGFAIARADKEDAVAYIKVITECDNNTASQAYDKLYQQYLEDKKKLEESQPQRYIPKCPTCGSPAVKKISGTKRWASTGLFGLGSSNIGKTMQCNNCGYKW